MWHVWLSEVEALFYIKFFLKGTRGIFLKLLRRSKIFIKNVISQDQKLQRSGIEIFEKPLFGCS